MAPTTCAWNGGGGEYEVSELAKGLELPWKPFARPSALGDVRADRRETHSRAAGSA